MPENDSEGMEFTDEQLRAALKRVGQEARRAAFAAGRPVSLSKVSRWWHCMRTGPKNSSSPSVRSWTPAKNTNDCPLAPGKSAARGQNLRTHLSLDPFEETSSLPAAVL
jgi:hypothetical protein